MRSLSFLKIGSGATTAAVVEQKKANNAPLVAGKQLPTPDSKPKAKEAAVAAKTPIYKDYVVVAVIMAISALAGALIRGLF